MAEKPQSVSETERKRYYRNMVVRKLLPRYPRDSGINHDIRVLQSIDSQEFIRANFGRIMAGKTDELSFHLIISLFIVYYAWKTSVLSAHLIILTDFI